jgi:hypothetical protein
MDKTFKFETDETLLRSLCCERLQRLNLRTVHEQTLISQDDALPSSAFSSPTPKNNIREVYECEKLVIICNV